MSHILIDAREYSTSTGRYMFKLVEYLEKADQQNDYTVLLKPEDMELYAFKNSRFRKLMTTYKEFTFAEQSGFLRQIKSLKPDLVHFGMTQQPVFYKGKVVTTVHDLTTARFNNPAKNRLAYAFKQRIYRWVIKRVATKSAAIITPSEYVKKDLTQFTGIDPAKISVTYEAADPTADQPEALSNLQNKRFLMYVGRPTPHKNLERLVEAYGQVKARHPDLVLALVGKKDANYKRVEALVQKKGIKDVLLVGHVSEGKLRWLYENCAAYVFPSLSEGFGLPGLEALAHGAPVISSNATCLPEIYGDAAH